MVRRFILFALCSSLFASILLAGGGIVQLPNWPVSVGSSAPVSAWIDPETYIRYWDFNFNDGTNFLDTSGSNIDLTNMPTYATGLTPTVSTNENGRVETWVSADGTEDCGSCAGISITQPMSVGGWFRWNGVINAGSTMYLFYNGRSSTLEGFGLRIDQNTPNLTFIRGGVGTTLGVLPSNQWFHITLSKTNNVNWQVETNGVCYDLGAGTAATAPSAGYGFAVAASWSTGPALGRYFAGQVDEVFVCDHPISAAQQYNHYYYTPPEKNLLTCYPGGNIRVRGTP